MQKTLVIFTGVAILIVSLLAWIGGEIHYRNCLTGSELRNPVAAHWKPGHRETTIGGVPVGQAQESKPPEPAGFVFEGQPDRLSALDECSRWPF